MEEKWVDISGWEKRYSISNTGRVKNLKTGKLLIGATVVHKKAKYKTVLLGGSRKGKRYYIHRLLAIAFLEIPDHLRSVPIDDLEVDHIDGDATNNSLSNLRWCTSQENCNFPIRRTNLSNALKGNRCSKGRKLSESTKQKIKESALKRFENNKVPWYNTGKEVLQIDLNGNVVNSFVNAERAAEYITETYNRKGYPESIRRCCNGEQKSSCGFVWRYKNKRDTE